MEIFSSAQESQFEAIKSRNLLSNNELSLYKYLLEGCDRDTLQAVFSLEKLSNDLDLAVNTIKSCRKKLKELSLISFDKQENSATTYFIRDIEKDPILETEVYETEAFDSPDKNMPNSETLVQTGNETQHEDDVLITNIENYDLSFIETELLPAYKTYLMNRIKYKTPMSSKNLLLIYSGMSSLSINDHKQEIYNLLRHLVNDAERKKVLGKFDFSFVDQEFYEIFSYFIADKIKSGFNFDQEQLLNIYTNAVTGSLGEKECFEENLKIV